MAAPPPFDPASSRTTVFAALLDAARRHGRKTPILEDQERQPLTYGRLVLGSLVLGDRIARMTERRENVGILLPSVAGVGVVIMGLNAFGRVAAMLNFTAGVRNLKAAVALAGIRTVVTSRRFLDQARLMETVEELAQIEVAPGRKLRLVYTEDLRKEIGARDKARGILRLPLAARVHRRHGLKPDDPAVILFTSGTEGTPKGVVLTNANLVANARQIYAHAGGMLSPADTVFNPLPVFHSFGLTAATLMPLLNGIRTVLYPSPLHYKQVPALIAATKATFLFATDTFLQGYGRAAEPGELASVRYVVAGAERVKDTTRQMWGKTGAVILEGYGATECSPVLACNLPPSNRPGSVGPLLPGIEARLEPVPGIAEGGKLMVRGPNVMAGYIFADRPGVLVPPHEGWHDTGDIVTLDADRFVSIKGRAKRFAKIGGEMVSLAAVESMVADLWPDASHVVVSIPDPRKGEQLVLVTDKAGADRAALQAAAKAQGFAELWVPRAILVVAQIPVLGSGKVDFGRAAELAREMRPLL